MQLAYSADVIRSNTAEITEILTDTVLNPKFNPWEVAEQIYRLKEDLKKYSTNHLGIMQEVPLPKPRKKTASLIHNILVCSCRSIETATPN